MSFGTFPEALENNAIDKEIRSRVALESKDAVWTYRQLAHSAGAIVNALAEAGAPRKSRVGLLAERNIYSIAALLGIMTGGHTVCPIDARLSAPDIRRRFRSAGIRWIIADSANEAKARQLGCVQVLNLKESLDSGFSPFYAVGPEDEALMLFTSGSTGAPKAVLLTHGNLMANALGVAERTGVTPDDRLLHAMPIFHTNGINNQLIVPLLCGAKVALLEKFRAETFFDEMQAWRPTYVTGVPTMFSRLLPFTPPKNAISELRFVRCGAAPLSEQLHKLVEEHLGVPLVLSYGLSEATCTSAMNPPAARKYGTVGTALSNQSISIRDPSNGKMLGPDEEGEICIAGPAVMKTYVPEQGPEVFYEGHCLRSGDIGKLDADGYLSITGRLKDVIIRGGENISPGSIESVLSSHRSIKECVVVGQADQDLGEVPVAFVVLNEAQRFEESALKNEIEEKLSRIHVPKYIFEVSSFPVNSIGKIDRKALKAQVRSK